MSEFRVSLVENVLMRLLWSDFFVYSNPNGHETVSGKVGNITQENISLNKKSVNMQTSKYPMPYFQELGKCIVEVLVEIHSLNPNLLSPVIVEFEENCIKILQQEANNERIETVILLMSLLEQHAVLKGETWPLVSLVGPMLAKSFSFIQSSVSYYLTCDSVSYFVSFSQFTNDVNNLNICRTFENRFIISKCVPFIILS